MTDIAIEVAGLAKSFNGRPAVVDVNLRVPRACAFGFLGPNGAGKTTVARLLLGLTQPDGGKMNLLGLPVPDERRRALGRVGAIVEEPRFHGYLSGRQNLEIVAAARGHEARARIPSALERVGLSARAGEKVAHYSLGMRQRLGIARCLLADPDLLLLDEPMNGLDPAGIQEFRALVRDLVDEGRTVFLSSHLLDEIEKTCDRVAIVDRGRTLVEGTIADLVGATHRIQIACSDAAHAVRVLAPLAVVSSVAVEGESERVDVVLAAPDPDASATAVRELIRANVDVYRVEEGRTSLEARFIEMTTTLQEAA
ncbi:MAG TPA: ATP-binding cassette domain-containing protein [Thermoleophilaceae bacterium]|nr:ATP-binding cassette domain-containing protein [Thermoleophilaceae bacterium]